MEQQVTLIKLGGSVITNKEKPYKFRPVILKRLIKEIRESGERVIIFHGSGSFGHTSASKYGGNKGYKSRLGIARVSFDSLEINRLVMEVLVKEKVPAISLRPTSLLFSSKGVMKRHNFRIIKILLDQKLIPVLHGDVIWDEKWKTTIFSGETIAFLVAKYLLKDNFKIDKIIQVGITNGVYDNRGKTIKEINTDNLNLHKGFFSKSKSTDVTGGMRHKIDESMELARLGIPTFIINGNKKMQLSNALAEKEISGTVISV